MHKQKRRPKITRYIVLKKFKVKPNWSKIAFPFIRRIFDGLSTEDLISVQPMVQGPSGMFFYYNTEINKKYYKKIKI